MSLSPNVVALLTLIACGPSGAPPAAEDPAPPPATEGGWTPGGRGAPAEEPGEAEEPAEEDGERVEPREPEEPAAQPVDRLGRPRMVRPTAPPPGLDGSAR